MNFIHEALHTIGGGDHLDDLGGFGRTGYVTDFSNMVRSEMGADWGQRKSYLPMNVRNYLVWPYDESSYLHLLEQAKLPLMQRADPPANSLYIIFK
jgi:hypothetical protein